MIHRTGSSLLFGITRTHKYAEEPGGIKVSEHNPEHDSDRNCEYGAYSSPQPSHESQGDKDEHWAQVKVGTLDTGLYDVTHKLLYSQVDQENQNWHKKIRIELDSTLDRNQDYNYCRTDSRNKVQDKCYTAPNQRKINLEKSKHKVDLQTGEERDHSLYYEVTSYKLKDAGADDCELLGLLEAESLIYLLCKIRIFKEKEEHEDEDKQDITGHLGECAGQAYHIILHHPVPVGSCEEIRSSLQLEFLHDFVCYVIVDIAELVKITGVISHEQVEAVLKDNKNDIEQYSQYCHDYSNSQNPWDMQPFQLLHNREKHKANHN